MHENLVLKCTFKCKNIGCMMDIWMAAPKASFQLIAKNEFPWNNENSNDGKEQLWSASSCCSGGAPDTFLWKVIVILFRWIGINEVADLLSAVLLPRALESKRKEIRLVFVLKRPWQTAVCSLKVRLFPRFKMLQSLPCWRKERKKKRGDERLVVGGGWWRGGAEGGQIGSRLPQHFNKGGGTEWGGAEEETESSWWLWCHPRL